MKRALFFILAVVMFGVTAALRHDPSDIVRGFGIVAMFAMWILVAFAIPITPWECSMERWKSARQRGRAHYVLVEGCWWLLFLFLMGPSTNFAFGEEISWRHWWIGLLGGILAGPVWHLWYWKRREREYQEWEKTVPLPENGVV